MCAGREPLHAAFDCVGGDLTGHIMAATGPGMSTYLYGALGGAKLQLNAFDIFMTRKLEVRSAPFPCSHL